MMLMKNKLKLSIVIGSFFKVNLLVHVLEAQKSILRTSKKSRKLTQIINHNKSFKHICFMVEYNKKQENKIPPRYTSVKFICQ